MDAILLRGIKTHNLKNISLVLPHGKFYVVTGVSGSGNHPSHLTPCMRRDKGAMSNLFQLMRVSSLSAWKDRTWSRCGDSPAIAIEAKNVVTNARSTVGTQTEINDYLRVLFSRLGRTQCPDCHLEVVPNHPETVARSYWSIMVRRKP